MELEEDPMVAWHEWQPADDPESHPPPPQVEALLQRTPQRRVDGHRISLTPSRPRQSPLWDIEVCIPTHVLKRQRLHTPIPFSVTRMPRQEGPESTPVALTQTATPHYVGPTRNTFQTPQHQLPMSPRVSQRPLESLNLVMMDEEGSDVLSVQSAR